MEKTSSFDIGVSAGIEKTAIIGDLFGLGLGLGAETLTSMSSVMESKSKPAAGKKSIWDTDVRDLWKQLRSKKVTETTADATASAPSVQKTVTQNIPMPTTSQMSPMAGETAEQFRARKRVKKFTNWVKMTPEQSQQRMAMRSEKRMARASERAAASNFRRASASVTPTKVKVRGGGHLGRNLAIGAAGLTAAGLLAHHLMKKKREN